MLIFTPALLLEFCAWHEENGWIKSYARSERSQAVIPEFWFSLVLILSLQLSFIYCQVPAPTRSEKEKDTADRGWLHLILPVTVVVMGHLWYLRCLYDPQYDFGGSAGRLCAAGEIKRANKK